MRDIFEDLEGGDRPNPMEAARRAMRPQLRARFYKAVGIGEAGEGGFPVLLDGRGVRTPARKPLAAPLRTIAEAVAAEWEAQRQEIDPAAMPLTRLANVIIDRVAAEPGLVRAEVEKYLGSDLIFYRATSPAALAARQAERWDPLLQWAEHTFGARFVLTEGVTHVAQPKDAVALVAAAIPGEGRAADAAIAPWRLGAVNVVTTLTGSALIALALAAGRIDADAAWAAAHVDEDWNMEFWGRDELALERRSYHFAELKAAAQVLALLRRPDAGSPTPGGSAAV